MIKCLNGSLVTSIAAEQSLVPMENEDGEDAGYIPAGRNEFIIIWRSGSLQFSVGSAINPTGFTHDTLTAAGSIILTASPELLEGGVRNIRVKGSGTFFISW